MTSKELLPPIFLRAAYGAQYKTVTDMAKAWRDGKDFRIYGGPYCSVRDIEKLSARASAIYLWHIPSMQREKIFPVD